MAEKIQVPAGFSFAGLSAGIKKNGKKDLAVAIADKPVSAAAVFTTNLFLAAPVLISKERVKRGKARAILANSGNANCGTGEYGMKAAKQIGLALARQLGIDESEVLLASTGVIGEPLKYQKIIDHIPAVVSSARPGGYDDFVQAIMTTDTRKKISSRAIIGNGKKVRILGFAKGAGMIQPLMATMLGFIFTDAQVSPADLKGLLKKSAQASFNRVTIDGDTSTNDTLYALASGANGAALGPSKPGWKIFAQAFSEVCLDLATKIAEDGEGASRYFYVEVKGAGTAADAEKIARRIANSPLVKTALSAADPNWGRIVAAAGISGARFKIDQSSLALISSDGRKRMEIFKSGARSPKYQTLAEEKKAVIILNKSGFRILFEAGRGRGAFEMITCDFTQDYVKINADYRS